jgi:hypothetical protein
MYPVLCFGMGVLVSTVIGHVNVNENDRLGDPVHPDRSDHAMDRRANKKQLR